MLSLLKLYLFSCNFAPSPSFMVRHFQSTRWLVVLNNGYDRAELTTRSYFVTVVTTVVQSIARQLAGDALPVVAAKLDDVTTFCAHKSTTSPRKAHPSELEPLVITNITNKGRHLYTATHMNMTSSGLQCEVAY